MRAVFCFSVVVLASLVSACAPHGGTAAERTASFAPHKRARIGGQAAWNYLLVRSGWVTAGDGLEARLDKTTSNSTFNASLRIRSSAQFGTVAAIDRRGYFLTAAHNLQGPTCYVAFYKDRIRLVPAQVVWRGNESKGEPDVALIRVNESLPAVFPWEDTPRPGGPALSAGLDVSEELHLKLVAAAGSISRVTPRRRASSPWSVITHDTPLHHGDSGGPLVTPGGRLLGINTEVHWFPPFAQSSIAQRPDPAFVRQLIERDLAAQRTFQAGVAY